MEVYWVWLSGLEGLGTRGRIRVLSAFGTPERAYRATEAELREAAELTAEDRAALMDRDLGPAEKILRECREKDIRVIPLDSPDYPALLAEISDPPPVLYCAGVLPDTVRELTVAVVGTRKASAQGLRMAKKLGYELSRAGTVVVSGCAEGADRAAMEGALRGGSAVVGVLGCGVEVNGKAVKDLNQFDLANLRWSKVVICTDGDVDGFQIRTLILTMLYRLCPTLIREGYVYIAETPLFEITCKEKGGEKTWFAYSEREKADILKELSGKKVNIQRSKGLGENDPEMMWLTTMNPETRRLIRVLPEEAEETARVFDLLLGDNLAGRKDYIAENGCRYLDMIDVS